MFFVISALFLEPLFERIRIAAKLHRVTTARTGLLWGALGSSIALVFIILDEGIDVAIHHSPLGGLILFFALLFVPGIVTLAWIAGARRGRRAALYGALAGFTTDFVARSVLWLVTGSIVADFQAPRDAMGTAIIAATAGGIQAGFYAFCGGLALDWARSDYPARSLALALLAAITFWSVVYHLIGGAFGLPAADVSTQFNAFIVRAVDYGGWALGLLMYPGFAAAIRRDQNDAAV